MLNVPNAATIGNPTSPTVPPTTLHDIVAFSFEEAHGFAPHPWQIKYIAHVLQGSTQLQATKSGIRIPRPFLICRSTGGGKSACRNTLGFIQGGVTLTIIPLLSLGADQTNKLESISTKNNLPVQVYHLDEYRAGDANRSLICFLEGLHDDTVTVFLFSSPQKIASTQWSVCLNKLIKRKTVPFTLCVDECHLYAQFGSEFRSEFHALKAKLFDVIIQHRPTMPILFLTATASDHVLKDLENLTSLQFDRTHLLWSSVPSSVSRREINLDVQARESPLLPLKTDIRRIYKPTAEDAGIAMKKIIFYSNSLKRLKRYKDVLCTFLDEEAYLFDVVIVHGELFREQKFHHIQTFCKQQDLSSMDMHTGKKLYFVPRILLSTAGVAGAGLDDPSIRAVHRDGYPATLLDYIQEAGRSARYLGALPSENRYLVNISWKSFCGLLFRIYIVPVLEAERKERERLERLVIHETTLPSPVAPPSVPPTEISTVLIGNKLAVRQYANLLSVLKVIHLYPGCLHDKLEHFCVNPFVPTCHRPNRCGNACFYCLNTPTSKAIYRSVSRFGLTKLLIDVFIKNFGGNESCTVNSIYTTLATYTDPVNGFTFNQMVFLSDRKVVKVQEVQLVLLQLFSASILVPKLIGKHICCVLTTDVIGNPNVNNDDFWLGLPISL